jgi:ParB/RepB/Spo0J family partition protein
MPAILEAPSGQSRIAIARIAPNPKNPRVITDKEELAQLTASLKAVGLIQPIVVRPIGDGFQIVAGHRRFAAAKALGWTEIPSVVRACEDKDLLALATTENIQRDDMHPLDEAVACRELTMQEQRTQSEAAALLGKSQPWVAQRLSLLNLSDTLRKAFKAGKFNVAHALAFARIANPKVQDQAYQDFIDQYDQDEGYLSESASCLISYLEENYTTIIKRAPFDTADGTLLAKAPACGACPKRSGACAVLFEELDKKADDRCLDLACWQAKAAAARVRVIEDAKKAGGKIVEGDQAQKVLYGGEYEKLDGQCYEHPKRLTWRQVMKGRTYESVVAVRENEVVELVDKKTAREALVALLPKKEAAKAAKAHDRQVEMKEQERKQRKAAIEKALTERAYVHEAARQAAASVIRHGFTRKVQGVVLDHLLQSLNYDGQRQACAMLGLEPVKGQHSRDYAAPLKAWRKKLDEKGEQGAILQLVIVRETNFTTTKLKDILPALGVDAAKAHKAAVEIRAKAKQEKQAKRGAPKK